MVYLNKCGLPRVHTEIGLKQIYMKLRQQQSHLLQGEGNSLHVLLPCSPKPCYSQTPHRRICKIPTASHSLYNVHTDSQHSFSGLEQCREWRRKDPCNIGLKEIKAPLSRWKELRNTGIISPFHGHHFWEQGTSTLLLGALRQMFSRCSSSHLPREQRKHLEKSKLMGYGCCVQIFLKPKAQICSDSD